MGLILGRAHLGFNSTWGVAEAYGISVLPVAAWSGAAGPLTHGTGRDAPRRWIVRKCERAPRHPAAVRWGMVSYAFGGGAAEAHVISVLPVAA